MKKFFVAFIFFSIPVFANASVVIDEIMYDLEGSDSGREWVEIFNNGNTQIDLTGWKFFEANTNHALTSFQGSSVIQSNGFAIIADNPEKFLADWPNFSGIIFDSSFSLSNTGESLALRNGELADIDSVSYDSNLGANGDGNSLQKSGEQWIAASPTPGSNLNSTTVVEPELEPTPGVDSSTSWPVEPQIYADAGADKTAVAGADIVFSGKALGLEKEPLDGARFLWSFGDGAIAEGKSVRHVYKYPGEYIVVLDVSSGKYSASDRLVAKIIPNQLKIVEANQNYIKLHNGSNVELDISFWFLRAENSLFKFPANTFIKTNKDLMIDSSISGIPAAGGKAELLYPNGSPAVSQYVSSPQTFSTEEKVSLLLGEGSPQGGVRQEIESKSVFDFQQKADEKENQIANVISSAQEDGEKSNTGRWLAITSGVGVISAAGLIFVRRKGLL